jgi:hypothetical protein
MSRSAILGFLCCCAVFALDGCTSGHGGGCTTQCGTTAPPPPVTFNGPGAVPQPPPATNTPAGIYLLNVGLASGNSQVISMPLGASGTVPINTLLSTSDGVGLSSFTSDGAGHFFAVETTSGSGGILYGDVLEFGATSSGAFTPLRRISEPSFPSLSSNGPLGVDSAGDLAVVGNGSIYIYGPTANGTVTPVRTIGGSATGLALNATALSFDTSGNLYVLDSSYPGFQILVFGPEANGNVALTRTITSTTLQPTGMTLDSSGNVYLTVPSETLDSSGNPLTLGTSLYEFAAGASGDASPMATMTVSDYYGYNLAFDTTGGLYLFVSDLQGNGDVLKFHAMANGTVAPDSVLLTAPGSGTLDAGIVVVGP